MEMGVKIAVQDPPPLALAQFSPSPLTLAAVEDERALPIEDHIRE